MENQTSNQLVVNELRRPLRNQDCLFAILGRKLDLGKFLRSSCPHCGGELAGIEDSLDAIVSQLGNVGHLLLGGRTALGDLDDKAFEIGLRVVAGESVVKVRTKEELSKHVSSEVVEYIGRSFRLPVEIPRLKAAFAGLKSEVNGNNVLLFFQKDDGSVKRIETSPLYCQSCKAGTNIQQQQLTLGKVISSEFGAEVANFCEEMGVSRHLVSKPVTELGLEDTLILQLIRCIRISGGVFPLKIFLPKDMAARIGRYLKGLPLPRVDLEVIASGVEGAKPEVWFFSERPNQSVLQYLGLGKLLVENGTNEVRPCADCQGGYILDGSRCKYCEGVGVVGLFPETKFALERGLDGVVTLLNGERGSRYTKFLLGEGKTDLSLTDRLRVLSPEQYLLVVKAKQAIL